MTAHAILLALAPVFFVMALGYGAGKFHVVDNRQVASLNALVMDFAVPASLFAATAAASRAAILAQGELFVLLGAVMLLLYLAWYWLARTAFRTGSAEAAFQALTIAFPNLAGVGLPIAAAVIGPQGTFPVAVAIASGSIIVSPLTLVLAELDANRAGDAGAHSGGTARALRRALTKPVVLAPAAGIVFALLGIDIGPVIEACLKLIGYSAAGVALFLTGLILSAQAFRLDLQVVLATVAAGILRPLLAFAAIWLLKVPHEVGAIAVLMAAIPSGFFGILFAVN